jgi:hypothetical protein
MANYQAVFAVGDALKTFLQNAYSLSGITLPCQFKLFASPDMTAEDTADDEQVSLYLHRITMNENFRAASVIKDNPLEQPVLFLDLHYLITYWGKSAQAEQTILTWTMQQLQAQSVLDASSLSLSSANAAWDVTESVQLTAVDLTLEDILRIWESFGPKYRLSLSYIARVVRIDQTTTPGAPVVATRYDYVNGPS